VDLSRSLTYVAAGDIPWHAFVWSAYLCGGDGAMIAGRAAARLFGLIDAEDLPIEVDVPGHRAPRARSFASYRRVDLGTRACGSGR